MPFSRGSLPVILQAERSECALACLAMVLSFHGHDIAMHTLRARCQISAYGSSLKTVLGLAADHALAARPLRLEPTELEQLALPAILHWSMDHFVILKQVGRSGLVIHDQQSASDKLPGRRRVDGLQVLLWN